MSDMQVAAIITANPSGFISGFARVEEKITGFGRHVQSMGNRIKGFGDNITGGLTSLMGGLGIATVVKRVYDLDTRLYRLANNANIGKKEMLGLKDELLQMGKATIQGPEDLLSAIEKIVEKTGNLDFAVKSLRDMGIVASATGADMGDIGASASDLMEKFKILPSQIIPVFDFIAVMGDEGAFNLKDMASKFAVLLPAAQAFGVEGTEGLRKFIAMLQIFMRGTGDPDRATTSILAAMSNIVSKHKEIKKMTGFSIFDPEKSTKTKHVLKDIDVIFKEIAKRTGGDLVKLQEIFGEEGIKGMKAFVALLDSGFSDYDRLVKKGGDGAAIMQKFSFWSESTSAKLRGVNTQLSQFADLQLAGPIDNLNKALTFLNEHPVWTNRALKALLTIFGVGWGAKAVGKVLSLAGGATVIGGSVLAAGKTLAIAGAAPVAGGVGAGPAALMTGAGYAIYKAAGALKVREGAGWLSERLGGYGGPDFLANAVWDMLHKGVKNEINMEIHLKDGRVITETSDMNTKVKAKLNTGKFE